MDKGFDLIGRSVSDAVAAERAAILAIIEDAGRGFQDRKRAETAKLVVERIAGKIRARAL